MNANTPRVLVVDDLPDVRFSFMFMLQGLGYEVAEASDGAAALSVLASQQIHVVLTDLSMPGMDGVALARAIRALPPPRPYVIAMSGVVDIGMENSREAAQKIGVDAILRKPITRDLLLSTIRAIGDGQRSRM